MICNTEPEIIIFIKNIKTLNNGELKMEEIKKETVVWKKEKREVIKYKTTDGKIFLDKNSAETWEEKLKEFNEHVCILKDKQNEIKTCMEAIYGDDCFRDIVVLKISEQTDLEVVKEYLIKMGYGDFQTEDFSIGVNFLTTKDKGNSDFEKEQHSQKEIINNMNNIIYYANKIKDIVS